MCRLDRYTDADIHECFIYKIYMGILINSYIGGRTKPHSGFSLISLAPGSSHCHVAPGSCHSLSRNWAQTATRASTSGDKLATSVLLGSEKNTLKKLKYIKYLELEDFESPKIDS